MANEARNIQLYPVTSKYRQLLERSKAGKFRVLQNVSKNVDLV